jgi:hypothetical protein
VETTAVVADDARGLSRQEADDHAARAPPPDCSRGEVIGKRFGARERAGSGEDVRLQVREPTLEHEG